jgi:glutamate-5-semialdehyde dehydrogenase
LIHQDAVNKIWPSIAAALLKKGISIRCDSSTKQAIPPQSLSDHPELIQDATAEDFRTEFLSLTLAVKAVPSVEAAIKHINTHGSHHTDAIITENSASTRLFTKAVDSAGVYVNASTRFADGFRYGFGTEVGVSTNKTHARGP